MPGQPFTIHRGTKPRGKGLPMHAHGEAQLTFAASGMVQVHTGEGRWLVPPQLAVWIPAGIPHRVEVLTDAALWMVHWQPAAEQEWAPPTLRRRAFALRVTPLLRSLLAAAFAADTGPEKAELVVRLMLHELTETADAPTFLPLADQPRRAARGRARLRRSPQPAGGRRTGVTRAATIRPHREPAVPGRNRAHLQGLATAGADRARHGPACQGQLDRPGCWGGRLRQHGCVLMRLPAGDGHDADHVPWPAGRGNWIGGLMRTVRPSLTVCPRTKIHLS